MNHDFLNEVQGVELSSAALTPDETQRVLGLARAKMPQAAQQGAKNATHTTNPANAATDAPMVNRVVFPPQPQWAVERNASHTSVCPAAPRRKRSPLRTLLIAAILACGLMASAYAVSELYKMQQADIGFYATGGGATSQYEGLKTQMEQYNAIVNKSVTSEGISLTLDNVAVGGNVINAFFTLRSEQPIDWAQFSAYGDGVNEPDWCKLQWAAAALGYRISTDAGELCASDTVALDYHKIDDNTFQYMVRIVPSRLLPDVFTLALDARWLLGKDGVWEFAVPIDSTDMQKPTVLREQELAFQTAGGEKKLQLNYLAVSPFGVSAAAKAVDQFVPAENPQEQMGEIVPVEGAFPMEHCLLTDNKGNTLYPFVGADGASLMMGADRGNEYVGAAPDASSITFTPIHIDEAATVAQDEPRTVSVLEVGTKLAFTDIGGYVFKECIVENSTLSFVLEPYGFVGANPELHPNDHGVTASTVAVKDAETGETVQGQRTGLQHIVQDYKTGEVTISITYYAATDEELRQIQTFDYYYRAGYSLDTAAAVTLPLA